MYEFEVLLKNGERTFIWGYNYQRRSQSTSQISK